MPFNFFKHLIVVLAGNIVSLVLLAQATASISGIVKDKNDQKPLTGATVLLSPGNKGATTSESGAFRFAEIEAGSYSLTITSVGYKTVTITNLVITTGNENTLAIELEPEPKDLTAVTVT